MMNEYSYAGPNMLVVLQGVTNMACRREDDYLPWMLIKGSPTLSTAIIDAAVRRNPDEILTAQVILGLAS